MRRRTAAFVLLALAQAPARAADAPERVIRYSDDRLSVKLTLAPVAEVIDEIGHQTGAEIRGQLAEVREVSAEFDEVPLPEALHRLLGTQNFALVYGDKGKLKALELLGAARTSGGPVASAPRADDAPRKTAGGDRALLAGAPGADSAGEPPGACPGEPDRERSSDPRGRRAPRRPLRA
jgi:hypothetical protein